MKSLYELINSIAESGGFKKKQLFKGSLSFGVATLVTAFEIPSGGGTLNAVMLSTTSADTVTVEITLDGVVYTCNPINVAGVYYLAGQAALTLGLPSVLQFGAVAANGNTPIDLDFKDSLRIRVSQTGASQQTIRWAGNKYV